MPFTDSAEDVARNVKLWTDDEEDAMRDAPLESQRLRSLTALADGDTVTARYLVELHDAVPGFEVTGGGHGAIYGTYLGADEEDSQLAARQAWAEDLVARRLPLTQPFTAA